LKYYEETEFEVTEKLEGQSITAFFYKGAFGICSRNCRLKLDDTDAAVVKTLQELGIPEILTTYGKNIALQGELVGPGIQANYYSLNSHLWKIFDLFLIDEQRYATPSERFLFLKQFNLLEHTVPVLELKKVGGLTVGDLLKYAEGVSVLSPPKKQLQREGIVFKSCQLLPSEPISFKAISNVYELKRG